MYEERDTKERDGWENQLWYFIRFVHHSVTSLLRFCSLQPQPLLTTNNKTTQTKKQESNNKIPPSLHFHSYSHALNSLFHTYTNTTIKSSFILSFFQTFTLPHTHTHTLPLHFHYTSTHLGSGAGQHPIILKDTLIQIRRQRRNEKSTSPGVTRARRQAAAQAVHFVVTVDGSVRVEGSEKVLHAWCGVRGGWIINYKK